MAMFWRLSALLEVVDLIPTKEEWNNALSERYGEENRKRFAEAIVAICGLGGLGSAISLILARAGVGKLILIDFDKVDITNIHRQQYKAFQIGMEKTVAMKENLMEISPYTEVEIYTVCVNEENAFALLQNADIICEAFDNAENKAMLTNIVLERMPEKFLITASGMAGMGSGNTIKTRRALKKLYVCGDEQSDVEKEGLISSRVMICAAHQAHMALRIISEQYNS